MLGVSTKVVALVAVALLPVAFGSSLRNLKSELAMANTCIIENGFDYVGNDIGNALGATETCCDKCGAIPNCAAWSWSNYNGGTCWFKSLRGNVIVSAGVKSALRFGGDVQYCTVENDVDYVDNDIGNKPSATAEGCCPICQTTAGCRAFSWNGDNGGTCYLKSKGGQKIAKAGVRSAMAYPTGDADCPVQEKDVDYVGNDLTNRPSGSADGCCALCKSVAGCVAYSWSTQSGGTCYLKSAKTTTMAKAGVISAKLYDNPTPPACPAQETGMDYVGNDLTSKPSPTADGCCQLCKDVVNCRAYSWSNQSGGTCYLKTRKGDTIAKAGVTSAKLSDYQDPKCNWERGVDYINNDIGNTPGAVESCCGKCAAFPGCRAYSWNNFNGGTCWLKSNKGQTAANSGAISSVVYF